MQQVKIRLYGIDCPEKGQAFGNRAKQATSKAVFGKHVTVRPMDTDRLAGRWLLSSCPLAAPSTSILFARAWLGSTQSIARRKRYVSRFGSWSEAREQKKGLWADKAPVPPWEWRKKKP